MPASASIILASRNEGDMLRKTLDSMLRAPCQLPFEIIVVDDGSTDGSAEPSLFPAAAPVRMIRTPGLGVAPARNAGARAARGEMLVFCDAHITVPPGWLDALSATLVGGHCDAVTPGIGPLESGETAPLYKIASVSTRRSAAGCGRNFHTLLSNRWLPEHTAPRECPILSGACFAVRRAVWEAIFGYEDAFRGYGYDEEEISLKLWLFGYRIMTAPEVTVLHKFRAATPYPASNADFNYNRLYAALCHFGDKHTQHMIESMGGTPEVWKTILEIFTPENLKNKRAAYAAARAHDDDWYFAKFAPDL